MTRQIGIAAVLVLTPPIVVGGWMAGVIWDIYAAREVREPVQPKARWS